jgi:serine/threonine-protein kinase RsbW
MDTTVAKLQIVADLNELSRMRQFVEKTAVSLTDNQKAIDDIILALDEAVTNIIRHGYKDQPGTIEIIINRLEQGMEIKIHDESPAFDLTQAQGPDLTLPLSQRKPGGLGIHMIKKLTHDVQYRLLPNGKNELRLFKRI